MALVNMEPILKHADRYSYGVGAFNILTMEGVKAAVRAAEDLRSPLIMQLAEVQLEGAPMELMIPMMIQAAKDATIPVAVHFDHGVTYECIEKALRLGCTSVMFDGASLSLDENIRQTAEFVKMAHSVGATIEAELGRVGGSEDGEEDIEMMLTDVSEVREFVDKTHVDALAIAIGNAHGAYKRAPDLQFKRLADINKAVTVPLVLHGGSGISTSGFRECISNGIQKINVATALQQKVVEQIQVPDKKIQSYDYFSIMQDIEQGYYEGITEHMKIFMSEGKVGL